jgi:hypothetical protein
VIQREEIYISIQPPLSHNLVFPPEATNFRFSLNTSYFKIGATL